MPLLLEAGAPAAGMIDILRETGFSEEDVSGYVLSLNIRPPTLGPSVGNPRPGGLPGGLGTSRPGGGLLDCTETNYCDKTCSCSGSCLFTS